MNQVKDFLRKLNIKKSEPIVVAVSYGPDSMFLLSLLKNMYDNIICAHVHHNYRKESDVEAVELQKYCEKNNIIFEFMKIEGYKNNRFTEEEARNIRYNYFETILSKYNSKYLFTAHHGDDLIETILMKLVRGSSITGYCGIKLISKRKNYNIIRPLLFLTKDQILAECSCKKIPYAIDNSNESVKHTRNRYRKEVVGFLKKESKNVHTKFLQFSNLLQEYDDYINNIALEKYKLVCNEKNLDVSLLKLQDDIIIDKVLRLWLYDEYNNGIGFVSAKNMRDIMAAVKSDKASTNISMPQKKIIIKSYNKLYFADKDSVEFKIELKDKMILPNGYIIEQVDKLCDTSNYSTAFNSKDLKLPLYFRNKKDGDTIEILGLNGSKKLKNIFIDEKITKDVRNKYPVLVDSNDNILWLPGLKKSKYDKSKFGKYDIILKCYREEEYEETKREY